MTNPFQPKQEVMSFEQTAATFDQGVGASLFDSVKGAFLDASMDAPIGVTGEGVFARSAAASGGMAAKVMETLFGIEAADLQSREGFKMLSVEELANIGIQSTVPMNTLTAQLMLDHKAQRNAYVQAIESGPSGLMAGTLRFGASIFAHLADPLELTANVAFAPAASAIGARVGLGTAEEISKQAFRQRFFKSAAVGSIDGFISEAAVQGSALGLAADELEDFNFNVAMQNVLMGTVAGGGFHGAISGFSSMARWITKADPDSVEQAGREAVGHVNQDKVPDPTLKKDTPEGVAKFREEARTVAEDAELGRKIISEKSSISDNLSTGTGSVFITSRKKIRSFESISDRTTPVIDNYGDGVYGTNSFVDAEVKAADAGETATGNVIHARIEGANLLDLDKTIPEVLVPIVRKLDETLMDNPNVKDMTMREVLDSIKENIQLGLSPENTLNKLRTRIAKKGFGGYIENVKADDGRPFQSFLLFDKKHLRKVDDESIDARYREIDPKKVQQVKEREIADQDNPDRNLFHDPEDAKVFDEMAEQGADVKVEATELDKVTKDNEKIINESSLLTDEQKATINAAVREEITAGDRIGQFIDQVGGCLLGLLR